MKKNILNRITVSGIFAFLFFMNISLISQNEFKFSVKGEWTEGPCSVVDTNGNEVVVNNGCKIEILNFPSDTEVVSLIRFDTRGYVYDCKIKDGKAFLGINGVGLSILDISDPGHPYEMSFLSIKGFYPALEFLGDKLLYATNSVNGFKLIDISDINSPMIEKTFDLSDIKKMVAKDNYIYASKGSNGMSVYELTIDNYLNTVFSINNIYCYDTEIRDKTLGVLGSDALLLYDNSNPIMPVMKASIPVSNAQNLGFCENFIICSGYRTQCIDISDLTQPVIKTNLDNGGLARDMIIKGNKILSSMDSKGFKVQKIEQPGNIMNLIEYKTGGYSSSVAVKNNTAYLAQYKEGICVLDISDPNNIKKIKSIPLFYATDVKIQGNFLFCSNLGLLIFNILNPHNPVQISYFGMNETTWGMKIIGNLLYLASGLKGLSTFNISDINNPYKIGEYNTPGEAKDVDVNDNKAYVADMKEGLRIINTSDPANPVEIGSSKAFTNIYSAAVAGDYAYVGSANYGIKVLDISNPAAVTVKKEMNNARGYRTLIDGNLAFVAGGYEGLVLFDITDPGDPVQKTVFDTPGNVYDIFLDNDFVYLADYDAGFKILKNCPKFSVVSDYEFVSCYGFCDGWIDIKNVMNASTPVNYIWNNGLNTPKITGLCKGTYTVTITDNHGCSESMSFFVDEPNALKLESLVKTDITSSNPKGSINTDISGGTSPYSYNWTGPEEFTSTEQNISGLEKGCYTCTVTDTKGCIFITEPICIEDKTSGIIIADEKHLFRISPNPANSFILVEKLYPRYQIPEIELFSLSGDLITRYCNRLNEDNCSVKIDISRLPPGIFCLRIRDRNEQFCKFFKLVKI